MVKVSDLGSSRVSDLGSARGSAQGSARGSAKMIWFTSDTHFDHFAAIQFNNRPYRSVEEMNKALIDNHNALVGKNDTVYHLGDFAWCGNYQKYLDKLNGNIVLLKGNHDRSQWIKQVKQPIRYYHTLKRNQLTYVLCHYPIESWEKQGGGSIHLHGHCHGTLKDCTNWRRMDVGVDLHDYKPISIDEIESKMLAIKPHMREWEK